MYIKFACICHCRGCLACYTKDLGLSDSLDDYGKQYFINMKMSPKFLRLNTQKKGIDPMDLCAPWADYFIHNWKKILRHKEQNKDDVFVVENIHITHRIVVRY